MKKSNLEKVNFQMIRYANCWEDADLLLQGLAAKEGGRHLSIGSAGDNSFSLLTSNPELVIAVDVSPVQIYLIELKKAAIKYLDREAYLQFAGFNGQKEDTDRWKTYCSFRETMPPSARSYWNNQRVIICDGIIYSGKFEKYFRLFSKYILPLIHNKNKIDDLLLSKDANEQEKYYQEHWNNRRWRMLFRLFFSRKLMGWLGRDPAFLEQVKVPVAEFIFQKTAQHLKSKSAQSNYMLEFVVTGKFKNNLPHYVRSENYDLIKQNLDRLVCRQGFAETAIHEFGKFDYFNLSNIFEYLDQEHFTQVAKQLLAGANPGAKMAYWNLMVERKISNIFPQLKTIKNHEELQDKDKGFFYQQFLVERMVA